MFRWQLVVFSVLLASGLSAARADTQGRYLLGPQDRVTIRVYDLRRNTGEAYSWTALNGEFGVGADGYVSLPLIGRVQALGGTTSDLADTIGRSLKEKADLAETPAASVEVAKYRPFYVTGAVQLPGKYEYQPNLSVLQAVSTAQGLVRATDLRLVQREVVTAGGDLRSLTAERTALDARRARLEAEIMNRDSIVFGDGLGSRGGDPKVDQALRGERLLFETRRSGLKSQVAALEQLKVNYQQELATLSAKAKSLDRQIDLSRRELELVSDLVAKGLTITPRKLAAEQSQASYESSRLDVQVATLRAQQSLSQAERDIIELQSRFRRDTLTEAAETRLKLDQNEERMRTAERLVSDAESQMLGADGMSERLIVNYEISRVTGTSTASWSAQEDDLLEPGDVVRVTVSRQMGNGRKPAQLSETRRISERDVPDLPAQSTSDADGRARKGFSDKLEGHQR